MPDAKDGHGVMFGQLIDDDVGPNGNKLAGSGNPPTAASARKDRQTVSGKQQLPANPAGGDGIFLGDMANHAGQVGEGDRLPIDPFGHRATGTGASKFPAATSSNHARTSE